ncbi:MAG: hypothetical protein QXN77_08005 [Candidatus Caldarchaeum sp.]
MSAPRTPGTYYLRVKLVLDTAGLEAVKKQLEGVFKEAAEKATGELKRRKKRVEREEKEAEDFATSFRKFLEEKGRGRLEGLLFGVPLGGGGRGAGGAAAGGMAGVFAVAGAIFFILEIVDKIAEYIRWIIDQFRKASLVFDSIFKLLNIIWMLGIKPFADLIGILLRPFLILVLRYIVIPFYRAVMPAIIKMLRFLTPERVKEMFPFFSSLLDRVKAFFDKIGDMVRSGQIDKLIEIVGKFLLSLVGIPIDLISRVVLWLIDNVPKIVKFLNEIWPVLLVVMPGSVSILSLMKGLIPLIIELGTKIRDWLTANKDKIADVFETVAGWLTADWLNIKQFAGKVLGWLKGEGPSVWEDLTGFAGKVVSWIRDRGKATLDVMIKIVEDVSNWIRGGGGRAFESLKNLVSQVWSWIAGYGARAVESLINFFIDVYNWFASTGRRVWNGLISSITGMVNILIDFVNGIIDFINTYLGGLGIKIPRIPRLEAGGLMLGEITPIPHISINISVGGSIYGVDDLNELMEEAVGRAARRIYEQQVRGVR